MSGRGVAGSLKTICALLLVVMATTFRAGAAARPTEHLVLAATDQAPAPIVLAAELEALPLTRGAVGELADYIEKIIGMRPAILFGQPEPLPQPAIWVGYQPVLQELFPGLDFDFRHPEEILIAANAQHLVIAGRDRWDPGTLVVEGRDTPIEGFQQEYGTANAVYTFIQDHLHVRWLWPGDLGEDIIEQSTIAFNPFAYRYHPQFRQRAEAFRLSALGDGRGRSHAWARLQRLQLDSLTIPGGHGFRDWWARFAGTHPEYFALQPDGTRGGGEQPYPGAGTVKICVSNPEVWARTVDMIAEQLEETPHQNVFNVQENDSHSRGLCVCATCLSWDHPDGGAWRYTWQGLSQEYVAMTDRYITFWNKVEDLLKERFPDRDDLMLAGYAYGPSRPLPVKAALGERIFFGLVPHFPLTTIAEREAQKAEFKAWSAHAPRIYYRPNLFYYIGRYGLPEVGMQQTIEDWRFLAEHNCIGIYIDGLREHWATLGPQLYLIGKLTWNPYQDGRKILEDYYRRGFGPAAAELEAYWDAMQRASNAAIELPGTRGFRYPGRLHARQQVYTDAFFEQTGALLDRAAVKLAEGSDIYRQRVDFVRAGWTYTRLVYESVELEEAATAGDQEAQRRIMANWRIIEQIIEAHPMAFSRFLSHYLRSTGPFANYIK